MKKLKNSGASKEEVIEKAKELPKLVTKSISDAIRNDYDAINNAIQKIPKDLKEYGEIKHKLQELKKDVPHIYRLPKDLQKSIIEEINKILGTNRSNVNY